MVSEVNSSTSGVVTALESRAMKLDHPTPTTTAAGAAQGSDVVKLTDLATQLQQLVQSVHAVPAVDQERVEQFRQSIADGSYQIDASAIADKLTTFEAMLSSDPQES